MANTIVLSTTSASGQTYVIPTDCPAGTALTVECWGAGSGGSGKGAGTFGSAGAGGAYAKSLYYVTPNDVTAGASYTLSAGTAGVSNANSTAGPDCLWASGLNTIKYTSMTGAVVGTIGSGGALPTNWQNFTANGLTIDVVAIGTDPSGYRYIDVRFHGTTTGGAHNGLLFDLQDTACSASATWTHSCYIALIAGSLTNTVDCKMFLDSYIGASFNGENAVVFTPTGTLTRFSTSLTTAASVNFANCYFEFEYSGLVAIDLTLRVAGMQCELGASPTFYKSTNVVTQIIAKGGGATAGASGGTGGTSAASAGSVAVFAGGNGAAFNTSGSGGGGSGGKDGAGVAGNTSGVGGQGDATTGGLGGAQKATTPGNAGTANVEGGGGGGGLITVSGIGGAGAAPGGGGGGAAVATSTGGVGGNAQIRLTYTPTTYTNHVSFMQQLQPVLAQ